MSKFGTPMSEDLMSLKKFTLIQVGKTGSGKTKRMITAQRFGDLYVADLDGKFNASLRKLPKEKQKGIRAVNFNSFTFDETVKEIKEFVKEVHSKKLRPATFGIDTYTILTDQIFLKYFGPEAKPGLQKFTRSGELDGRRMYGEIKIEMTNLFHYIYSLPCNIIINCHIQQEEAKGEKKLDMGPKGVGSHRDSLMPAASDSHYLYINPKKEYKVKVRNSSILPVNTCIDDKFIDSAGDCTVQDLSIFDDYAYKV